MPEQKKHDYLNNGECHAECRACALLNGDVVAEAGALAQPAQPNAPTDLEIIWHVFPDSAPNTDAELTADERAIAKRIRALAQRAQPPPGWCALCRDPLADGHTHPSGRWEEAALAQQVERGRAYYEAHPMYDGGAVVPWESLPNRFKADCIEQEAREQQAQPTTGEIANALRAVDDAGLLSLDLRYVHYARAVQALYGTKAQPETNPRHCCNTPIGEGPHELTCWTRLRGFTDADDETLESGCHRGIFGTFDLEIMFDAGWRAALAQQAQPLTDESIEAYSLGVEREWQKEDSIAPVDMWVEVRNALKWARDRMAQQAREHALIEVMREGEHVTAVLARQAQPTHHESEASKAAYLSWTRSRVSANDEENFVAGWNAALAQQAQPERIITALIPGQDHGLQAALTDASEHDGWIDFVASMNRSGFGFALLAKETTQQACRIEGCDYTHSHVHHAVRQQEQPRCAHGRTDRHMVRATDSSDTDIWCPGPVAAPQPRCEHGESEAHIQRSGPIPQRAQGYLETWCPGPAPQPEDAP